MRRLVLHHGAPGVARSRARRRAPRRSPSTTPATRPDANPTAANGVCATAAGKCTLRAAIEQAERHGGRRLGRVRPRLARHGDDHPGRAASRPIIAPLTIEGGGDITIAPSAASPSRSSS